MTAIMIEQTDDATSEEGATTIIGDDDSEATLHSFMLETEASQQFTATDYEAPFVINDNSNILGLLRDASSKFESFHSESSEEDSKCTTNYLALEFGEPQETSEASSHRESSEKESKCATNYLALEFEEPQQTPRARSIIPIIIDDSSLEGGFVDSDSNKEDSEFNASDLLVGIGVAEQSVDADVEEPVALDCKVDDAGSARGSLSGKGATDTSNQEEIGDMARSTTKADDPKQDLDTDHELSLADLFPRKDIGSFDDITQEDSLLTTHSSVHNDMLDERFHMMFDDGDSEIITQPSLDEVSISSIAIDQDEGKESNQSLVRSSPSKNVRDSRFKKSKAMLYQPRQLPNSFGLVYGHGTSPAYLNGVSLGMNADPSRDPPQSDVVNNSNPDPVAARDLMIETGTPSIDLNEGAMHASFNHHSRLSNGSIQAPMTSLDLIYGDGASSSYFGVDPLATNLEQRRNASVSAGSLDSIYLDDASSAYFGGGSLGGANLEEQRNPSVSARSRQQNTRFSRMKNKKPIELKALRIEAFFYNRGMEIAMGVLYLALNYVMAAHGAYQFTEAGGFTTDNDLLRITLPIARAGGRLVTFNCAVLLLTSCKCLWTLIRTHVAPVIPIAFPFDDVMPKYHRYVALTVIVAGCIIHTLPQILNYSTRAIESIETDQPWTFWTFGNGFATKQLYVTGMLLTVIFATFFFTTLKAFRKTAAGFRWFWFFHVGGIATAYPLLVLHGTCRGHPVFFYFAMLPLVLYLFDISMRRSNISTTEIVRWTVHEDQGQQITELVVRRPLAFTYTPGQYVELRFRPISEREWHPFTIASAPNERCHGNQEMTFYIKNLGRWTGALFDCASAFDLSKTKKRPEIDVRGPHGSPAMNYFEYKHILVIGSGVGVAPLLSIWKYLVARGQAIADIKRRKFRSPFTERPHHGRERPRTSFQSEDTFGISIQSGGTFGLESNDDDIEFREALDIASAKNRSTFRDRCMLLQPILDSMTVCLSLFALFVFGETITIVLRMYGYIMVANSLGLLSSVVALLVYGITITVSMIARGCSKYPRCFKCWLECGILFIDATAIWFSIQSRKNTLDEEDEDSRKNTRIYLSIFGYVVFLHALRIFHMFYVTLKPSTKDRMKNSNTLTTSSEVWSGKEEICSVQGILINRKYSSMRFAAKGLLPPILQDDGLSDLFTMQFYGTREDETNTTGGGEDHTDEQSRMSEMMMGSSDDGTQHHHHRRHHHQGMVNSSPTLDGVFCAGRPDWNNVFLQAINRAHRTNREGDSVGVFFCGSPAIAKDLQVEAKRITAQHQFVTKRRHGRACKCKLIVHTENF